ncbi:MAG TPA: hypothetical protein VGQ03_09830, partial [Nitrososphaera sp.]|nr:hypothetical protein [Nitrososphaera sp.]
KKAEPTLMVHLKDLKRSDLIEKKSDGSYQTTDKGIELLQLIPNVRPTTARHEPFIEPRRMIEMGLAGAPKWINLTGAFIGEVIARGIPSKDDAAYYMAIGEALRGSVMIWLPTKIDVDKDLFFKINQVVDSVIDKKATISEDGKLRIMIDVDFPRALDLRIREEKNVKVRERLIQNREKIIKDVVKNWESIFNYQK